MTTSRGNAGNIVITGPVIASHASGSILEFGPASTVDLSGSLTTKTQGSGAAGEIDINVLYALRVNEGAVIDSSSKHGDDIQVGGQAGNAGRISIVAGTAKVGGSITTQTSAEGLAGTITLRTTGMIDTNDPEYDPDAAEVEVEATGVIASDTIATTDNLMVAMLEM